MSISTNDYTGKQASRRGNSILIVFILSIKTFIVDAKVKELVYSGNTVLFLLPFRELYEIKLFFSGHIHNQLPFVPSVLIFF